MQHLTRRSCSCSGDESPANFDQKIEALASQYRDLAQRLAEFMEGTPEDGAGRNARALRMAQDLTRIIGGREVEEGAFPECCLIGEVGGGGFLREWYCTGTLIHPRAVVTAHHCIGSTSPGGLRPNAVALGVNRESELSSTGEKIIRISKIVKHSTEDISLLILRRASDVPPVERANRSETSAADQVRLVGFGNSNPGGSMGFGVKREVTVPMQVVRKADDEDLSRAESALGFNSFTEFVAGRKGSGRDSCNGDSGGPAYIYPGKVRKLAGATSRATDEALDNCGDGGVYVRIDRQQEWIDTTIADLLGG